MPTGEVGRIGLAFATNQPNVVWMLAEAGGGQLLRSDDRGRSWRVVNREPGVNPRPFYFGDIRVDPTNENRIYRLQVTLDVSHDGGRNFSQVGAQSHVHVDHHALWIDPADGRTLINGNDGGVYISRNRGETWTFVQNLPLAQFYHISVDNQVPYNLYGGLQDNGSWRGPSQVWENQGFRGDGIQAWHWTAMGFGDGFAAYPDALDSTLAFSSWQGGNLQRVDLRTGEWKDIQPVGPDSTELRFNWNAGMALDPRRPGTVYYGSQFLHKTVDRGQHWTVISPDLTSNDPGRQRQAESGGVTRDDTGAENNTTILAIAPSPRVTGVIWTGSDDGKVFLTRDDGGTWTDVTPPADLVPEGAWVAHVEASHHADGTAYAAINNYRRGDWTTYVMVTRDFGESWANLDNPDPSMGVDGWVHTIEEDPRTPNLLWAGSEFGLFFSLDAGATWSKWMHGVPTVPVRSLTTHPRDHDLVIGTHGRAAMIIDDIRPVRALAATPEIRQASLHLFTPPDAWQANRGMTGPFIFPGHGTYEGQNRSPFPVLRYWRSEPDSSAEGESERSGEVSLEVLDGDGEVVRRTTTRSQPGLNQFTWPLTRDGHWAWFQTPDTTGPRPNGLSVSPGDYTLRLTSGADSSSASIRIHPDPRRPWAPGDWALKATALEQLLEASQGLGADLRRIQAALGSLDQLIPRLSDLTGSGSAAREVGPDPVPADPNDQADPEPTLADRAGLVRTALQELLTSARPEPGTSPYVANVTLAGALQDALGSLSSSSDRPTEAQEVALQRVLSRIDAYRQSVSETFNTQAMPLSSDIRQAGLEPLVIGSSERGGATDPG